ncbi:hypothetical protein D3C87_1027320 [compost metagenome]
MRWSKLILSLGILSMVTLVGCRKDSSTSTSRHQNTFQYQEHRTEQTTMENRSTTSPRANDGNKIAIGTPSQCYADLCQSNHELSLLELMSNAEKGSKAQREYYEKYINPMVVEAMKQRTLSEKATISLIQKYKDQFENLKLTDVQRRMFAMMYYLFKPDLIDVKARARIDKALSNLPHSKATYGARIKGSAAYLTAMHPGMDVQAAARQEALYILESRKKFKAATELNLSSDDSPAIDRANKGKKLLREDLDSIYSQGSYNRKMESLLLGEVQEEMDKLGYTEADFYQTYKNSKLEKRFAETQDFNPVDSAKCESSFYQSINLAPKKDEIERFEILKEQVKKASLSLLSPSDPAYAVVEKTDFYLPYNSEENVKAWRDGFKVAVNNSKKRISHTVNFGVAESFLTAFVNAMVDTSDSGLCDGIYDPSLIDSITPEDGASRLSWMTVRYPKYGISVLAHEIGHVIFKHSKQFSQQMTCIKEQNGSDKYTAEDFADLLAIKAEKNLEDMGVDLRDKKGNVGCLFASARIGEGLTNTTPEDNHSSHLFRALKFALYRKQELPASCQALARSEKSNVLTSCDN